MQKQVPTGRGWFVKLWSLGLLYAGVQAASVSHIFFNCSVSTTQYFSQSLFACNECGTNQVTDGWRSCACSPNFKTTSAARQTAPGISYPCTACDWNTDKYCPPASASQCSPYTTLKRIVGYEEVSPLVCMPCSYGEVSEYSCQCPASTGTTKSVAAYPNLCIETDPTLDLRTTWQALGNQQSLLFKCNLQKVVARSPGLVPLQTGRRGKLFRPGQPLHARRLPSRAAGLQVLL
jgi:hypothetical protein